MIKRGRPITVTKKKRKTKAPVAEIPKLGSMSNSEVTRRFKASIAQDPEQKAKYKNYIKFGGWDTRLGT